MPARGSAALALLAVICWGTLAPAAHPTSLAEWVEQEPGPVAAASYHDAAESIAPGELAHGYSPEWQQGGEESWVDPQFAAGGFEQYGFPDGGFGDDSCSNCGDCGPVWFADVGVLALKRSTAHHQILATTPQIFTIGATSVIVNRELLSTRSLDFNYQPGLRVNLGRYLGTDLLNRTHSLEFMYFGLQEWNASNSIVGDLNAAFVQGKDGQFIPALTGRIFSPFPLTTGGFNRAESMAIENSSTFNNFEVNYRIRRGMRPGRKVGWPDGSWTRECTPSWTPSMLAGIRYISFNDQFQWLSRGSFQDLSTGETTPIEGDYKTRTTNDLLGGQIGGDLVHRWCKGSLGFRAKVGLYGNANQQYSQVRTADRADLFELPNGDTHVRGYRMSFVGEFGFVGAWNFTPNFAVNASYDFLWLQGVALAPEQLSFHVPTTPQLLDSGSVFLQGVSLGAEFKW